ncbi:MAG: CDP-alcohol phosphatidyltransferase family protein [Chitinophagales bacterium]
MSFDLPSNLQIIEKWTRLHALGVMVSVCMSIGFGNNYGLLVCGLCSTVYVLYANRTTWQAAGTFGGMANGITTFRIITMLVILQTYPTIPDLYIGLLSLLILVLDGFDGYFARKNKTTSLFGEYYDKECDALYVMILALIIYQTQKAEIWVLGLGLIRYVYVLALIFFKPPEQKETRSFFEQSIAVILMASLLLCFVTDRMVFYPLLVIATGLLLYSFGRSFWQLQRLVKRKK